MHAAVIAAGEGLRLSQDFSGIPKPLVPIRGKPLVDWLFDILMRLRFESISIVVRESHEAVIRHLIKRKCVDSQVNIVCKNTAGGAQSIFCLEDCLKRKDSFFLFTIDNIFNPIDLEKFLEDSLSFSQRTLTCWTTFRDSNDQGQVGVVVGQDRRISAIGKDIFNSECVAEGPMHCFSSFFAARRVAERVGICRLSDYIKYLLASNHLLYAYPVSCVFDVDDIEDHKKAEEFLSSIAERE